MEHVRDVMYKMLEWVPEQNRNGPRPAMREVCELVSAALEKKNKEIGPFAPLSVSFGSQMNTNFVSLASVSDPLTLTRTSSSLRSSFARIC